MPKHKANPEEIEPVIAGDEEFRTSAHAAGDAPFIWYRRPWLMSLFVLALCSFTFVLGWEAHSVGNVRAPLLTQPVVIGAPPSRSLLTSNGVAWRLSNRNESINVAATLPGVAHEALLAAKVLAHGSLLYRDNELAYSWVAAEDWTFSATFTLDSRGRDAPLLEGPAVLRLDGMDTFAAIVLNGETIGEVESAFVTYELPVRAGLLYAGLNTVAFRFRSALRVAREASEAYPYEVPHRPCEACRHGLQTHSQPRARSRARS